VGIRIAGDQAGHGRICDFGGGRDPEGRDFHFVPIDARVLKWVSRMDGCP